MEKQLKVVKETKGYWRVIFSNPPRNQFDPWTFAELNHLMDVAEADQDLKVIVFESGNKDFFMGHHDVAKRLEVPDEPGAQPFFYKWPDFVTRLINSPIITISKVRGRAYAQGFEFALATDMIFAAKKEAKFALVEAGGGSMPGGGGIEWLTALVGRSRAIEIVLSADEYNGALGEKYGFVNRAFDDDKLDEFVDKLARRIGSFAKRSLLLGKKMINARAKMPTNGELFQANYILRTIDDWPEANAGGQEMSDLAKKYGEDAVELTLPEMFGKKSGKNDENN
ncbi:enoyl-CoA hydratase/isomerase family protein [Pediococcus parvulus]|uniref:Enoyl-CoA hydratase n=1 Tax=Pediococcus parvulus TaxID=54062 RepID=A0A176TN87_9LACO|nr:enoyl-CoA hydratase/isomerase family protein [Pediococcus parvulus]MCT3027096.1 enoyl-CoA hydratase/isomerase family protein [Pediococcus parvulus]MDV7694842.1 enoyl-CoA hydratase/isomerase family protein [Pediococcus parvulus]OAD65032.1 enoyl-CoA hydratase [Pediococcus parvulus]GEL90089.1 enoyl-CoA hydratase [Pediococcus parvulus]GHC12129.1 enoyl-CoA hydratase [Pediococcus parvulus]